jgi:hypothetical protein
MGGVYGSFIEFFPELFEKCVTYTQVPLETAGYKGRKDGKTYRVIYQSDGESGLTGPAGRLSYHSQWRTIDMANNDIMWSRKEIPVGVFFIHPRKEKAVYRVVKQLDFSKEGGYYEWGIQRVTGDNGNQTGRLSINKGIY